MNTQTLRWSCGQCTTDITGIGNDALLDTIIKKHKCNN